MKFKDYWNETHKKFSTKEITYDSWLDNYQKELDKCNTSVLDLGCGTGNDALYLTERGFKVVACDYSEFALDKVKKDIKEVEIKQLDISETLPFKDKTFDLIVADLSLHYFDEQTTKKIMQEIKRILKPKGNLLARVNSTADINHGAGRGEKIEENFYFVEGYNKRFFTLEDAQKFFSIIGKTEIREADMLRYTKPKKVIEINVEREL